METETDRLGDLNWENRRLVPAETLQPLCLDFLADYEIQPSSNFLVPLRTVQILLILPISLIVLVLHNINMA